MYSPISVSHFFPGRVTGSAWAPRPVGHITHQFQSDQNDKHSAASAPDLQLLPGLKPQGPVLEQVKIGRSERVLNVNVVKWRRLRNVLSIGVKWDLVRFLRHVPQESPKFRAGGEGQGQLEFRIWAAISEDLATVRIEFFGSKKRPSVAEPENQVFLEVYLYEFSAPCKLLDYSVEYDVATRSVKLTEHRGYLRSRRDLTIVAYLTLIEEEPELERLRRQLRSFRGILESAELSDIELVVAGERFPAHRALLAARSPVFQRMISSQQPTSAVIELTDFEVEPQLLWDMLTYVYSWEIDGEIGVNRALGLLEIGCRYAIEGLAERAQEVILGCLDRDCVLRALGLAHTYGLMELKNRCIDFVVERIRDFSSKQLRALDAPEIYCEIIVKIGQRPK